jgi:hypothetical protein
MLYQLSYFCRLPTCFTALSNGLSQLKTEHKKPAHLDAPVFSG